MARVTPLVLLLVLVLTLHTTDSRSPKKCLPFCNKKLAPVCGSDGKTYDNMCLLEYANCLDSSITFLYKGECEDRQCGKFCPLHYSPVCDHTGKQYSNQCFLNIAMCEDDSIKPGSCGRKY